MMSNAGTEMKIGSGMSSASSYMMRANSIAIDSDAGSQMVKPK